jgi:hypothetical protein
MASFKQTVKSTSLLCAAALVTASGLHVPAFASHDSAKNCENGTLIGTFALQAERNSKFVKKDDGKLRATRSSQPTSINDKGVYQIYSLRGMPGATDQTFALRSTRDPDKWWRVRRNNHSVKLDDYQCRSDRTSTTFIGSRRNGSIALKSRKNDKWIYVAEDNNGKLKASSDSFRNDSVLKLISIGQAVNPNPQPPAPNPNPQPPAPVSINGWFKGNNFGYYTSQSSGSSFQMKAFTNAGKLLNRFEGTISGNRVTGTWRNYCNNRSGNATLLYENGSLRRIAGTTGNLRWTPISHPNIQLESQPSCNSGSGGSGGQQTPNLIGWWKGNNSGFYKIEMRQEIPGQNNFTMKGYSSSGLLLNTFVGRTIGSAITGSWRNNCNSRSGSLTLQYHSGDIIKVNGAITANTRWSRTNSRPANLTTNCPNTGGNQPAQPQAESKKQKIILKREIWIYDQNLIGSNKQGTTSKIHSITIERPTRSNSLSPSISFPNARHCIGNTNSLDKASAKVDDEGLARFVFSIQLKEGSCTGGVPIGSFNYAPSINVAPGQSVTRSYGVDGVGGSKVKITYTIFNQTN